MILKGNKSVKQNIIRYLLILGCIVLLQSCKTYDVMTAKVNVNSAIFLNPDINNKASPVAITLYQLSSPYPFNQLKYQQISNINEPSLSTSLLDMQTFIIRPDEDRLIPINLIKDAEYLGIVTAFSDIEHARWKALCKLNTEHKHIKINIHMASRSISIQQNK